MSHFVRLIPSVAKIGPAESTASPMSVGPRNSRTQRPSPDRGPRPDRVRPGGVSTARTGSPRRGVDVTQAPRRPRRCGPGSLVQELLERGRDLVKRGLRRQRVVVEDLGVKLVLERAAELVVALERGLEVGIRERVREGLATFEGRRVLVGQDLL